MDSKRAWFGYLVIRVLAFAVPFAAIMFALPGWRWNWVAGLVAGSIISVAVSYIFLQPQRTRMAEDVKHARTRTDRRSALDKEEDAALDEAEEAAPAATEDAPAADSAAEDTAPESTEAAVADAATDTDADTNTKR